MGFYAAASKLTAGVYGYYNICKLSKVAISLEWNLVLSLSAGICGCYLIVTEASD